MNETLKQSVIDLLAQAKTHIEAGETALAVEKIDAAVSGIENEGVAPAGEDEGGKPKDPPLPGTGSNGPL